MIKRPEMTAFFTESGFVISANNRTVPFRLLGSQKHPMIEAREPMAGHVNFLTGNSADAWQTDVPVSKSIVYRQPWPGIDMVFSSSGRRLKSEFIVAAGANPARIRWTYDGAATHIDQEGSLVVDAGGEEMREHAPDLFQEIDGRRVKVSGAFRVFDDGGVGFEIGAYDRNISLVIDPVITYSTFLGGSGQDVATAVATDASGDVFVAGWTGSQDLPANGAHAQNGGGIDAFVARLTSGGTGLVYCTYLGGSGDDRAFALAVDAAGSAYVTGQTSSPNFPVTGAVQSSFGGGRDAFIAKLNSAGNQFIYSTYLGGSDYDQGNGIALDPSGNAYVVGDTLSNNFPLVNPMQVRRNGGQDAFVAKINPGGNALVFSTYFGAQAEDHGAAIAVDSAQNVYITGSTYSASFPVVNAVQPISGGNQDAFVTKIAASGQFMYYSSYLGGAGGTPGLPEVGTAIAVDPYANAYVAGITSSSNFPVTTGAFQTTFGGGNSDGFVLKLNASGNSIVYSTYLGGTTVDEIHSIALDFTGNAYVAGFTGSLDFPTLRPIQSANHGIYNGFLTKLNTTGTGIVYSTYLGGGASDAINGVAVDMLGNALLAGSTSSPDFPVKNAAQANMNTPTDVFVTKISAGWYAGYFTNGAWFLDRYRNLGNPSATWFGQGGDIPVVGDWDGTGYAKMGIFRNGAWFLDYHGNGSLKTVFYGQTGDTPVVGDWAGTGTLGLGIFRGGVWFLDMSGHLQGSPTGLSDAVFGFGLSTDLPIVGDWDGSGPTKIGIFRGGQWFVDYNGDHLFDSRDRLYFFGMPGDLPAIGDWNGSGNAKPGIYRNGTWYLDYSGNWINNPGGPAVLTFNYGSGSTTPLVLK